MKRVRQNYSQFLMVLLAKGKDTIETDRPLSSENNIYLDKDTANYACWENVLYSRLKNTVVTD